MDCQSSHRHRKSPHPFGMSEGISRWISVASGSIRIQGSVRFPGILLPDIGDRRCGRIVAESTIGGFGTPPPRLFLRHEIDRLVFAEIRQ